MTRKPEPYDASNPKHVKAARKNRAVLDERMANGLAKIVADKDSRYVLKAFLEMAGPFRDTYVTDGRDDARNRGWQGAALWWINNGLLSDRDFVSKLQDDDGSPIMESQDDGHTNDNPDSDPDSGGS